MIVGIGTDIIEIQRIDILVTEKPRFITKNFTAKEQAYFQKRKNRVETIAGSFAAKEAVSKALGTGFRGFGLIDIEILRDQLGKPKVFLYGEAEEIRYRQHIESVHISISHCKTYATATAIAEKSFIL